MTSTDKQEAMKQEGTQSVFLLAWRRDNIEDTDLDSYIEKGAVKQ